MNPEELNAALLDFVKYLGERKLTICMFSQNLGYTTPNCDQQDIVASYMNVKTGGKR
jgi:hypothetical protein